MESSNGSNGNKHVHTESGPVDKDGERMKGEQEVIAIAIAGVPYPDTHWADLEPEQREVFMEMAAASVAAAQPPLPTHDDPPDPPYPAELLDLLAEQLAYKFLEPQQFHESIREAFDRYEKEVGRENVPGIVAKAIASL